MGVYGGFDIGGEPYSLRPVTWVVHPGLFQCVRKFSAVCGELGIPLRVEGIGKPLAEKRIEHGAMLRSEKAQVL